MKTIHIGKSGIKRDPKYDAPGVYWSKHSKHYVVVMLRENMNGSHSKYNTVAQFKTKIEATEYYEKAIKK